MRFFKRIILYSLVFVPIVLFFLRINLPKNKELTSPLINNVRKTGFLFFEEKKEEQKTNIGLVGDLGLGRYITTIARRKNDFNWSFSKVSSWLQQNDFNFANLESPIISNCPEGKYDTFIFCGDTRFLPYLRQNKFIFNLANNHIFNYGKNGFLETKNLLNQNKIDFIHSDDSNDEFLTKEINGITFGFLGFDLVSNKLSQQKIIDLVKKNNNKVDWLVVSLHWGNEYIPKPEQWRVDFAHELIDNGADIIAGHHPHVFQTEEWYKNKPIFYSLGNFIFDQNWSQATSVSKIIRLTLSKKEIIKTEITPIKIKYDSQPEIIF